MTCSYNSWKLSSAYEDIYPTPADYGWVHKDEIPNIDTTCDLLQGMVDVLYQTGNVDLLEHCLEELCGQYKVEFEPKELKLKNL